MQAKSVWLSNLKPLAGMKNQDLKSWSTLCSHLKSLIGSLACEIDCL